MDRLPRNGANMAGGGPDKAVPGVGGRRLPQGIDVVAYHGTARDFQAFSAESVQASGSATACLGTFFSASPAVAAHFTLKPEVISAGYDSAAGSRSLVRNPWQFDAQPFMANAMVLMARIRLYNPLVLGVGEWVDIVESLQDIQHPEAVAIRHLQRWSLRGHDGVLVRRWDAYKPLPGGRWASVETDAETYIVFDASRVPILERRAAESCLDRPAAAKPQARPRPAG